MPESRLVFLLVEFDVQLLQNIAEILLELKHNLFIFFDKFQITRKMFITLTNFIRFESFSIIDTWSKFTYIVLERVEERSIIFLDDAENYQLHIGSQDCASLQIEQIRL